MPATNNGDANGPSAEQRADETNGIELQERKAAEVDEPLLMERDDEGIIIHDRPSIEGSNGSEFDEDDVPQVDPNHDPFRPRRMSITAPARIVGRSGARFRSLKNFNETGGFENEKGMGVFVTSFFIIGETAGGGLVALPSVMAHSGILLGTLIIVMGAFICGYAGNQLAECWSIMMIRYTKYRSHTHKPYPAIGRRAIGRKTGIIVAIILNITQFGTAVVFILLGSKNIASAILFFFGVHISFCYVIGAMSIFVFPLILLRSPKDFWIPILIAMGTTSAAVGLLMYGAYQDAPVCMPHNQLPDFNSGRILQTFGTVMFAYGGHGAFPTIQHDMKQPHKFEKAVTGAFTGIAFMYLPVSLAGAIVYGSSLGDVVIFSIQSPGIQQTVNLLITLHVFLALTIVFNPINQDFEQLFNVPDQFTYKRVVVRAGVLFLVVLMALTVPNFGPLLDLVGGSTITTMAIIMPPLFSLYLNARLSKFGPQGSHVEPLRLTDLYKHNRTRKFVINVILIAIGVIGGACASYMSIQSMLGMKFEKPCYADFIFGSETIEVAAGADAFGIPLTQKFMCCGPHHNISALGSKFCLDMETIKGFGSHG